MVAITESTKLNKALSSNLVSTKTMPLLLQTLATRTTIKVELSFQTRRLLTTYKKTVSHRKKNLFQMSRLPRINNLLEILRMMVVQTVVYLSKIMVLKRKKKKMMINFDEH